MLSLVFGPFYGLAFMSQWGKQQTVENATRRDAGRRNMTPMVSFELSHRTLLTSMGMNLYEKISALMAKRELLVTPSRKPWIAVSAQNLKMKSRNFSSLAYPFYALHFDTLFFQILIKFLNFMLLTTWNSRALNFKSSLTVSRVMELTRNEIPFPSIWTFDVLAHRNIASICTKPASSKLELNSGVL